MPKIIHYRKKCIGCNSCVEHAPDYWKMDEDGKSTLLRGEKKDKVYILEIDEVELDCNKCAAMDCPVKIIKIMDDSGKDISNN